MRAMPLAFPTNALTRGYETQFICGDALLVAPIVREGGEVEVALPPGAWYDLNSRQRFPGQRVLRYKATLDQFPVFGREGFALPLGRVVQHTGEIDAANPLEQLWVFGKPTQALESFAQAKIDAGADGAFAIRATADVKVDRFGDAAGIDVGVLAPGSAPPPTLAITVGEPAGVGPELVALLGARHRAHPYASRLVVLGDRDVLHARAARIGSAPEYIDYDPAGSARRRERSRSGITRSWLPFRPGRPDPANARSVLATLARACDACATGAFAALVTGPFRKAC